VTSPENYKDNSKETLNGETINPNAESASPLTEEETRKGQFSKTAKAAKLSGAYHETAGFFKRKFGEFNDDSLLEDAGRQQQLLGKIHRLVGSLRGVREAALEKANSTRIDSLAVCRKHGGRLLDVASDFVDDMKKVILK
jgi:uncharacterized protein YjbJ (UPF0337 family)